MRKVLLLVVACLVAAAASGCSLVTVEVVPRTQPLKEMVLEGEGASKVLVIGVEGVLSESNPKPGMFQLREEVGMIARLKEELTKAEGDPAVKAVVLKVNSPGGSVTASDIILHELLRFKEKTGVPVVAMMMEVAASGGYYVSCAADRILAHPTTVTGSIGVLAFKVSAAKLLDIIGVQDETLKVGDKKDMWSPLRPLTPEERTIFQSVIDDMDKRFLQVVCAARKPTAAELATFSDGRILEAKQALKLRLVDRLGYIDDAIAEAKSLAKIEKATVTTYARPRQYRNNVYSVLGPPTEPNMLGMDTSWMSTLTPGVHFMYLWQP